MAETLKMCRRCRKHLPISKFYTFIRSDGKEIVRSLCIKCFNLDATNYRKSLNGLITQIYAKQKKNSALRGHPLPAYSKREFHEWLSHNSKFHFLYHTWIGSGCIRTLVPTCDRKDSKLPYTFDNIQVCTLGENLKNEGIEILEGLIGRSQPVICLNKDGIIVANYKSTRDAQKKSGVWASHIGDCCLGKRRTAGGFKWQYSYDL